jgi:hypothetical protein
MLVTIDKESKQRAKLTVDINFSGDRYKTTNNLYTFPAPTLETIDRHLYFLLKHSIVKNFDKQYIMRPDYMSYDEYSTVALAQLLMYINGVFSIELFNLDNVFVPSFSSIVEMLKDSFSTQKTSNLTEVNW